MAGTSSLVRAVDAWTLIGRTETAPRPVADLHRERANTGTLWRFADAAEEDICADSVRQHAV